MADLSQLSAAGLAADLEHIADRLEEAAFMAGAVPLLREAARRIAPATAALADVPPRLEVVVAPDLGAACACACHRLAPGLGYSHRTCTVDGEPVALCCATPGRHYSPEERAAALLAVADKAFG